MDRWSNLNMEQKAQLLGIYVSKGYTDLASIINHYNTFQAGGTISTPNFVQRYSEGQRRSIKLPNGEVATHKLSYAEQDGKYIVYPNVQPMDYSNPNSPLYDYEDDNWTAFDRALKNNDILQFNTAKEAEEYTKHYKDFGREGYLLNIPSKINLPEPKVKLQQGGSLGKVTSYGQWEYPHQITTIPSNNITMKGVNYPVLGISDTGDTKYMLPNKDYLFEGQYVTEYPLHKFQRGGNTDGISSGRWRQVDDETVTPEYSLPPVTIEAEHPLWSLPWYKDKKNNPNINRYKDQLYNNWRRYNEAGKEYLKRVAGGLSTISLPIGGAAGFILGVPDLATDFAEMIDKPSISNATELTLDAPTRYGTELDNALISVLESNKYTKPLAKILQYNDALQYIGAINDASSAVTGKSIIEHVSK